jgi:hypothetical protein
MTHNRMQLVQKVWVLLACRYMTAFSPSLCSFYLGEAYCLVYGGCESQIPNDGMLHTYCGDRIKLRNFVCK